MYFNSKNMISVTKTASAFYLGPSSHLKLVGYIAILLPLIVSANASIVCSCSIQESISHYYYTISGDLFVGMLCAIGTFMVLYKGYDKTDRIASTSAGIFAFGVALFPTDMNRDAACNILGTYPINSTRALAHYGFAAALFVTLAYMCLFLFTKSDKTPQSRTKAKTYRNSLYQFFGVLIVLCILIIFLGKDNPEFSQYKLVFWLEWIATYSFGIAWLIKGGVFLKDESLK